MRSYFIALACSWAACITAAIFYSQQHPQLHWIMTAALPAFLLEAVFYLGVGFNGTLAWFGSLENPRTQALLLWVSALLPYIVFSGLAGTFDRRTCVLLALLTGVLAWWFVVLPRRPAYDVGFLVVAAAPIVLHVFKRIYTSPDPHMRVDILGHLSWIHTGIASLLILRDWDPGAFGFWPNAREWRIGLLWYAIAIVPLSLLAVAIGAVHFAPVQDSWYRIAGVAAVAFFAILWVVALSEELFFRGFIERAFLSAWRSKTAAVLVSAALFGSVHLWFPPGFPNWRQAAVAGALGVACGIAYAETGSVRAPMVTHALVVATERVLFSK